MLLIEVCIYDRKRNKKFKESNAAHAECLYVHKFDENHYDQVEKLQKGGQGQKIIYRQIGYIENCVKKINY